jgi:hypothetical protein
VPAAAALAALTEGSKKRTAGSSDGGGSGSSSKASKKSKSSSSSSGLAPGAKKVGALMSQWVSVKQSLAKEEEEEAAREAEAADPEVREGGREGDRQEGGAPRGLLQLLVVLKKLARRPITHGFLTRAALPCK